MSIARTHSKRSLTRWLLGGGLIVVGVGWVGLMLWNFALMQLHLVPSWDVGLAIWYPMACITFPVAALAILVGYLVFTGGRRAKTPNQALQRTAGH